LILEIRLILEMNTRAIILVLALLAAVAPSHAAVFCVSTPTEFNDACRGNGAGRLIP